MLFACGSIGKIRESREKSRESIEKKRKSPGIDAETHGLMQKSRKSNHKGAAVSPGIPFHRPGISAINA
ncbi:hypothetical protein [Salibacterium lacus]|uniref:Uncharacterized protein n=1 Tax=Salibacterium lacus TaxID=1898109 RepID=A0ABW5T3F5_9BACI